MRWFYLILTTLVFLLLQAAVAGRIAVGPVAPDFLVLIVAFLALYRGAVRGAVFGFLVGLLQDLGNPGLLGLNALAKTILGFTVGKVSEKTEPDNVPFQFVLFIVVTFGHDVIYLLFYHWPHVGSTLASVFSVALPSAAYTALIGVVANKLLLLAGPGVVEAIGKEGQ